MLQGRAEGAKKRGLRDREKLQDLPNSVLKKPLLDRGVPVPFQIPSPPLVRAGTKGQYPAPCQASSTLAWMGGEWGISQ